MKVSVNCKCSDKLFELTDTQKKVICNDIHLDEFEADMKRRLHYILTHKYERCLERLKKEWEPKLKANGVAMMPTDDTALAELILAQPNYKCRKTRELEAAKELNK